MHRLISSFVLGFHGCDKSVADKLVEGEKFKTSKNEYDWLGSGTYFWEANPQRGLDFAEELKRREDRNVKNPAVVGAVIDLGLCLDLTSHAGIRQVKSAYHHFIDVSEKAGAELPKNSPDLLRRNLDCAVMEALHAAREREGYPPFDTVRGVFIEGDSVFPDAGIRDKTHIQIAVRNPDCIIGAFRVRPKDLD